MLGAIYIGLSGMEAYSKGLQTISNNVANLNTSGFKTTSVSFADQSGYGGAGLSYAKTDGERSGSGVRIAEPLVNFAQGDLRQSSNDLDLAIRGNGFLVLLKGDETYYTRTGQFAVDQDGYIAEQGSDYRLGVLDGAGKPAAINIDAKRTSPPTATTKIVFADNLSSSATTATVSDVAVYDDRGGKQVWTIGFAKAEGAGATSEWAVTVKDQVGNTVGTATLKFIGSTVDPSTRTLTISSAPPGASAFSVTLDFSAGVTSFSGGSSTLRAASVDGSPVGALTSVTVEEGQLQLSYSNEKTELLGSVALADFRDPQRLQSVGEGRYRAVGAGQARILASGKDGIGTLVSKQTEASNVDLSNQFGELILIQRGFQASSQVVSVSNDMIQQLFGIRGQG